jgi:hypothetical protein
MSHELSADELDKVLHVLRAAQSAEGSTSCPRLSGPAYVVLLRGDATQAATLVVTQTGCPSVVSNDRIWLLFNADQLDQFAVT